MDKTISAKTRLTAFFLGMKLTNANAEIIPVKKHTSPKPSLQIT